MAYQFVALPYGGPNAIVSNDGVNWTSYALPYNNKYWKRLVYSGSMYVGLADDTVITSPDGANWTTRRSGVTGTALRDLSYNGSVFLTVQSDANKFMTSPDGVTWTDRTPSWINDVFQEYWYYAGAKPGMLLAFSNFSDYATSIDNGVTWTKRTLPATPNSGIKQCYWTGTQFILIGAFSFMMTSPDGINWTNRSTAIWQNQIPQSVACNGNGTVVITYSSNRISVSTDDGATWSNLSMSGIFNDYGYSVAWNGSKFVAVCDSTYCAQVSSPDGITWTNNGGQPNSGAYTSVVGVPQPAPKPKAARQFLSVGYNSSFAETSPDGVTWTNHTLPGSTGSTADIAHDTAGTYVIVVAGPAYNSYLSTSYVSTDNGVTWSSATMPYSGQVNWQSVTWHKDRFIAAGHDGSSAGISYFAQSLDGVNWSALSTANGTSNYAFGACAYSIYSNGTRLFVARSGSYFGSNGLYSDDNGATWSTTSGSSMGGSFTNVVSNGTVYLGASDSSSATIVKSTNLATWTDLTMPESITWQVCYGNGIFMAVGVNATKVYTSTDGTTWTARNKPSSEDLYRVAFNGTKFVVTTSNNSAYLTTDGTSWTATTLANNSYHPATVGLEPNEAAATSTPAAPAGGTSSASLPLITGTGQTLAPPATGTSSKTLPANTASGLGDPGTINASIATLPRIIASSTAIFDYRISTATLPLITGSGTAGVGLINRSALPLITGTGAGSTGVLGESAKLLPLTTGAGAAIAGGTAVSSAALPMLVANGGTPTASAANLPVIAGAGTGLSGRVGGSAAQLTLVVGSGAARTNAVGGSTLAAPQIDASGAALTGAVGGSTAALGRILVASQGVSGSISTSSVTLPLIKGQGALVTPATGSSVNVLLPTIVAAGTARRPHDSSTAVAMQTNNHALTAYENFGFNSFAKFNGMYLAANESGIFALEGDTDAGTAIAAAIKTGVSDFGTEYSKRIDKMYVGYRTDGTLELTVTAGDATYTYPLQNVQAINPHGNRVQIGRGLQSRYWQFEVKNVAGADFEIDMLHALTEVLSRRTR